MSVLPINVADLLRHRTVEGERIEYKAGWNPAPIIRTLCAFANDFENLGGGYIVIGQDCDENGTPVSPPIGIAEDRIDRIQQELLQFCHLIQPAYFPVLSVEDYLGKKILVLWAPGGQNRPYKAPSDVTARHRTHHYYIRRYSSTVEAQGEDERELISLAASIPFDDRICHRSSLDDLKLPLIVEYLEEVGSDLLDDARTLPMNELGRQMLIVDGGDEYIKPRNVGLLFFNQSPEAFLPGTQIDVVMFPKGVGGGELTEKVFRGPLHQQLRDALRFLQTNVIFEKVVKHKDRAEALRFFNYPFAAIEEALVNAVYHRSYEQREPVEVRVNPEGIEIVSYPGPDASIRREALNGERIVARRYRNRRIGEFLKELDLTEGRSTGVPTIRQAMAENGSPPPTFSTDEGRTYFLVELPIHPGFQAHDEAHDQAYDEAYDQAHDQAYDELTETEQGILATLTDGPKQRPELAESLRIRSRSGAFYKAILHLREIGAIELTIPDKPQSKNQKMRLTAKGREILATRNQ
jgi:ATP-dependent DNA helicase RecG